MADDEKHGLAAIAYILSLITGIIVYLVADKDDEYSRWHAVQAIGFGIAWFILSIIVGAIDAAFLVSGGGFVFGLGPLGSIFGLLYWIIVIVLAIKAYKGEKFRLPVIADFADEHA